MGNLLKSFLTLVMLSSLSFIAEAQKTDDEIQLIQGSWGKEKRELVSEGMSLSAADSVRFWPIYEQYENERKKIGKSRLQIMNDYLNNYDKLSQTQADEIVNRVFKNDEENAKLMRTYYSKVRNTMGSLQAAKFLHIESYLQSVIKAKLQGELPFIGDLDKTKRQ